MTQEIPEGGWPEIPVVAPYEYDEIPPFVTSLTNAYDPEILDELLTFYDQYLIPQLACSPDGSLAPHPQRHWLVSGTQPRFIITCRTGGELCGAWIIRNSQIFYPCARADFIAPIFRALWDETIKHFDYVWGDTKNPVIMAFAQKAVRIPRSPNSPTVNDERLEWRRS